MEYFFNKVIKGKSFDEVSTMVKAELAKEGFGVPSEVMMEDIFKSKLGIPFRKYHILGACNPSYAIKAVEADQNIGVLLPCSVVVQELPDNSIGIAAIDPSTVMSHIKSVEIEQIASEITEKLRRVIDSLS